MEGRGVWPVLGQRLRPGVVVAGAFALLKWGEVVAQNSNSVCPSDWLGLARSPWWGEG